MKIQVDAEVLKELVYRMLRDIEDGIYEGYLYGEAAGMLSVSYTKAMDDLFKKLEELQ